MSHLVVDDQVLEQHLAGPPEERKQFCELLEKGTILVFPTTPFEFPQNDIHLLLERKQTTARYHKNISYRPQENVVRGVAHSDQKRDELVRVMGDYSRRVRQFLTKTLPPYAASWKLDYASFRPQQEKGRKVKFKARNDLLHVDAFPTRPTHGNRILRFFTNINPKEARKWVVGRPFYEIVRECCGDAGMPLPKPHEPFLKKYARRLSRQAQKLGLPATGRSRYDEFMLRFHDYLKANSDFQENSHREFLEFPPGCSWMVFTDLVPHAALSGQFALEQTFIVSRNSLVLPQLAPINVLEELVGAPLAAV